MFDEQETLEQQEEPEEDPVVLPRQQGFSSVKKQKPRPLGMIRAIKDLDVLTSCDIEVKKRLIERAKEQKALAEPEEKNAVIDSGWFKTDNAAPGDSGWQVTGSMRPSVDLPEPENEELPAIGTDEFEHLKQELLAELRAVVAQGISMSIRQNPDDELIALITHCAIPGCVVHTINFSGDIEEHFTRADVLEFELDIARSYLIRDNSQNISHIEVFKQHLQVVYGSGAVETVSVY